MDLQDSKVGEGIEKGDVDFAAEVAAQITRKLKIGKFLPLFFEIFRRFYVKI